MPKKGKSNPFNTSIESIRLNFELEAKFLGFNSIADYTEHLNRELQKSLEQIEIYHSRLDKKDREKSKRLYNTYGITLLDKQKMLKEQNDVCWICQTLPKSGILCVDHRHVPKYKKLSLVDKAKEVRGLLCFSCNTGLHGLEKRKNARFLFDQVTKYFQTFKIKGDE